MGQVSQAGPKSRPRRTDFEPFQIISTDVLFHKRGFEGETRLSNVRIAFARLKNGLTLVDMCVSRYCMFVSRCVCFHDLFVYECGLKGYRAPKMKHWHHKESRKFGPKPYLEAKNRVCTGIRLAIAGS